MMRRTTVLLTLLLLASTQALAGQCNVTSSPLSFGLYDTLAPAPVTSTNAINISCKNPPKIAATVTVQLSTGGSGSFASRSMTGSTGGSLSYNLYADSARTSIIGDGTGSSTTLTRTVDKNTPWSITLYGQIPPLQPAPAGTYSDTLTATILW